MARTCFRSCRVQVGDQHERAAKWFADNDRQTGPHQRERQQQNEEREPGIASPPSQVLCGRCDPRADGSRVDNREAPRDPRSATETEEPAEEREEDATVAIRDALREGSPGKCRPSPSGDQRDGPEQFRVPVSVEDVGTNGDQRDENTERGNAANEPASSSHRAQPDRPVANLHSIGIRHGPMKPRSCCPQKRSRPN